MDKLLQQKVVSFLKHLGLEPEEAQVYLQLLSNGPQTVLAISRSLKSGRTKLYPMLEKLAAKQLVTIHERHYGTSYEAQDPEVLEFLVNEREQRVTALRASLPVTIAALKSSQMTSPATSKIIEYRGADGLKQMNWNLTKADGHFKVFELAPLQQHPAMNPQFVEKLRRIWKEKNIQTYDLTNNSDRTANIVDQKSTGQIAYIDPKIFTIEFETYIYNNCVALLNYEHEDIFGVEIYNQKLARQQEQIFDMLWTQAKKIN